MHPRTLVIASILALVPLSGCLGGWDFVPGEGFKETGRTIHLRMWVEDMVQSEVYPGLEVNWWAFCAEPANPDDAVSAAAIEHRDPNGIVVAVQPDGSVVEKPGMNEKCSVPGPQIRIQQGDRLIVDFDNIHFHAHTIHWHGQMLPWESDGAQGATQDTVAPGTQFRYDFIAKKAGTLWYHCHVDTQFHIMQGLYGVIIIEPQDKKHEPKGITKEYTWVLSTLRRDLIETDPYEADPHAAHRGSFECGITGNPNCQNPAVDVTPDTFMINGRSFPSTMDDPHTLIHVKEGDVVRLRILNAGETFETLHPHGHDMLVTHRDGSPLRAPFWVDTLTIGPAERYDVVMYMDNPGPWMFHTHVASHETNDGQAPGGMHSMIVYEGFEHHHHHQFLTELPGGQPFRRSVEIPQDFRDSVNLRLPDQPSGDLGSWSFPVREPCAVREIHLRGYLRPDAGPLALFSEVDAAVRAPDGTTLQTFRMSPLDGATFRFEVNDTSAAHTVRELQRGDYSVAFSGRSVQATMELDVLVDYYRDLAEADAAALDPFQPGGPRELCGMDPPPDL